MEEVFEDGNGTETLSAKTRQSRSTDSGSHGHAYGEYESYGLSGYGGFGYGGYGYPYRHYYASSLDYYALE